MIAAEAQRCEHAPINIVQLPRDYETNFISVLDASQTVEAGVAERHPWYDPMEGLPQEPLFNSAMEMRPRRDLGRPGQSAEAS